MNQSIDPVSGPERMISLDIMRGFAIFGIFLVNMLSFHSPILYLDPLAWWSGTVDQSTYVFIDIFAQASFYPLFALLFGYGFVILRERTMKKGLSFNIIAVRRFFLLLLIGTLHAFFIWHGDILINYAIFGFLFLLFAKMKGENLILTGIFIYFIPNFLILLLLTVMMLFVPSGELSIYDADMVSTSLAVYQNGLFSEITWQRMQDWYLVNNLANFPFLLISIFPLFLIGGGAAKLKWLEDTEKHRNLLRKIAIFSLICGPVLKLLPYIWGQNWAANFIQDSFGGPLLAVGYGLALTLFVNGGKGKKLLAPLSYVGRLSLSNYLLQSVLATMIFYGYGLGLYGRVSAFTGALIVVVIFICQVFISRFWVHHFYYGPVEWVWRAFTYFQRPKWKRRKQSVN